MKIFVFILTVFFMLTVTLQESLAQAATESEDIQGFVRKFSSPVQSFYPQSKFINPTLSGAEADITHPESYTSSSDVALHADTVSGIKEANRAARVSDVISGKAQDSGR